MSKERLAFLLEKYKSGADDRAEREEMLRLLNKYPDSMDGDDAYLIAQFNKNISHQISAPFVRQEANVVKLGQRDWLFRAAIFGAVVILAGAIWKLNRAGNNKTDIAGSTDKVSAKTDKPDSRVMLTIENGINVSLEGAKSGQIAKLKTGVVILDSNTLSYNLQKTAVSDNKLYHTVSTKSGRRYHILLADGSGVWLNAGSSLRFLPSLGDKERRVELTGEGYFEIAANRNRPFIVTSGTATIAVLGTSFDVNAYNIKKGILSTTLLVGSVAVEHGGAATRLIPYQQAIVNAVSGVVSVRDSVDVAGVVSWKNNRFMFNGSIRDIMQQVAVWYDVAVTYEDDIDVPVSMNVSRDVSLKELLHLLEMMGSVHFDIAGNKVVVRK